MPNFNVLALGVGDAFSVKHFPTAFVLSAEGWHLAVDCPDRYEAVLEEAVYRSGSDLIITDIDTVLITHLHGDHVNGLEMLAYRKYFLEGKRLNLICSREIRSAIWEHRLKCSMGALFDGERFREMCFEDYFKYVPLEWSRAIEYGPFAIEARPTKHHIPTSALLVRAASRTWGYSCDTAFDPDLIDFLSDAHLIFHETNEGRAHTPYECLAALPQVIRDKVCLVHYPDSFDRAASEMTVVTQGESFDV